MKKIISVDGSLVFPLQIGRRAVIRRGGDFLFTSLVVKIREDRTDFACFETMRYMYRVSPVPVPAEAAISFHLMRAA